MTMNERKYYTYKSVERKVRKRPLHRLQTSRMTKEGDWHTLQDLTLGARNKTPRGIKQKVDMTLILPWVPQNKD